ncbi:hypothetical protein VSU01S_19010 [Vibrio superstes NBRC 103154]|uniref:Uncharacterized protein n=1 Tax=Vibrio superstes NBRC 103154 TaxID=1219062 RepID=A0A511QRY9_9VIBR|nr:hypothetical protein VSU01S_19010 [Vibrio superstes NBRC 103154]
MAYPRWHWYQTNAWYEWNSIKLTIPKDIEDKKLSLLIQIIMKIYNKKGFDKSKPLAIALEGKIRLSGG